MAEIARLSWADLNNLAVETADWPMHQMVLAMLERAPLLDGDGRLRIEEVRTHVAARLGRVPDLRRVLHRPGLLRGRPIWVDDSRFRIENHVLEATVDGGVAGVIAYAESEMSVLMDRSRPLWRVWLLDAGDQDRIGMLIKVHHALADGPAMVNILAQVFDLQAQPCEQPVADFVAAAPPPASDLIRNNLALKTRTLRKLASGFAHPVAAFRAAAATVSAVDEELKSGRGAPRSSLNRPTGRSRRLITQHLSLSDVKSIAHCHSVTVNDVFLYLVASGLRQVLASRGELRPGMSIRASMAVSSGGARFSTSGNHAGVVVVQLPVDLASPGELLAAVAAATARAKTRQLPTVSTGLMVALANTGIAGFYIRRQHIINMLTTNVPGPPVPLFFAGSRVFDPVAIAPLAGNVTVSFAALSYSGGLALSAVADGDSWPDLQVLDDGIRAGWSELADVANNVPLSA